MKTKMSRLEKFWVLYDVGNSAFTLLVSTIIPIYYKNMASANGISASDSTAYLSYAISISTLIVAVLGPVLGAVADNKNRKKPLFTFFMMMGVLGCAALAIPRTWILFLAIFVIAKVGFSGSLIFYDSMLVDVTTDERMDEVSSQGYAWGYIGSCVPFVASLGLILGADAIGISGTVAMMIAFFINAAWWVVVTLPLLRNYQQKYYVEAGGTDVRGIFSRLGKVFAEIRDDKKVLWFLAAFFFYIDGVYTIIEMADLLRKRRRNQRHQPSDGIAAHAGRRIPVRDSVRKTDPALCIFKTHFGMHRRLLCGCGLCTMAGCGVEILDDGNVCRRISGSHPGALPFLLCQDHPEGKVDGVFRHLRYFWKRSFLYGNNADGNHHAVV